MTLLIHAPVKTSAATSVPTPHIRRRLPKIPSMNWPSRSERISSTRTVTRWTGDYFNSYPGVHV